MIIVLFFEVLETVLSQNRSTCSIRLINKSLFTVQNASLKKYGFWAFYAYG